MLPSAPPAPSFVPRCQPASALGPASVHPGKREPRCGLPAELTSRVLAHCDLETLVDCRQVTHSMRRLAQRELELRCAAGTTTPAAISRANQARLLPRLLARGGPVQLRDDTPLPELLPGEVLGSYPHFVLPQGGRRDPSEPPSWSAGKGRLWYVNFITGVQRELFADPELALHKAAVTSASGRWVITRYKGALSLFDADSLASRPVTASSLPHGPLRRQWAYGGKEPRVSFVCNVCPGAEGQELLRLVFADDAALHINLFSLPRLEEEEDAEIETWDAVMGRISGDIMFRIHDRSRWVFLVLKDEPDADLGAGGKVLWKLQNFWPGEGAPRRLLPLYQNHSDLIAGKVAVLEQPRRPGREVTLENLRTAAFSASGRFFYMRAAAKDDNATIRAFSYQSTGKYQLFAAHSLHRFSNWEQNERILRLACHSDAENGYYCLSSRGRVYVICHDSSQAHYFAFCLDPKDWASEPVEPVDVIKVERSSVALFRGVHTGSFWALTLPPHSQPKDGTRLTNLWLLKGVPLRSDPAN